MSILPETPHKTKTKDAISTRTSDVTSERRLLLNQLIGLEKRRDVIEKKYADDKIDHEVYLRLHSSVQAEIDGINQRIADIQSNRVLDLNLIEEVLNMTRNIYETYQNAPDFMKQLYLRFFFERIEIKNKKVSKYIATPTFQTLLEGHRVLKLATQLPNPDIIIATVEKLLMAFENVIQMELIRVRWEEIKRLSSPSLTGNLT